MSDRVVYAYAILRAVPHVYLGTFHNVGVIVHAPTREFLGMRALQTPDELRRAFDGCDVELFARYLASLKAVCEGDESAGPMALAAQSERFHWMTAPRSDVIQSSPVHEGIGDPQKALDDLFASFVQR